MYEKMKKGLNSFLNFTNSLTGAALLIIMCIVLVQVFCRLVIFKSLAWSEELSRYLMVFMVLFGFGMSINEDMLIKIDAIDALIHSERVRNIMDLVRIALGLACAIPITISSTSLFKIGMIQKSAAMQIPMIVMYAIVFLSFVNATIALIFKTIDCIRTVAAPGKTGELEEGREEK